MRKLLWLILLLATPALATDYYVRTDGNDSNTGLANTAGGAWRTIGKCMTTITAGNRCRVQPGEYLQSTSVALANSGTVALNDAMTDCKCTAGSATITCGTTVSGISAGQFVRCDATGPYFNWTRVASVAGNTINLDEGYLGVSSAGNTFLDVANFVEIIGDGSAGSIIWTSTTTSTAAGITFSADGTWSGVYYYDTTGKPAPWNSPEGFRFDAASWDRYYGSVNGKDTFTKVTPSSSPCSASTCAERVYRQPGSWCQDGTRIYFQLFDGSNPNSGVLRAGYGPITEGSTWINFISRNYVQIKNFKLIVPNDPTGFSETNFMWAFSGGGNNSIYREMDVENGGCGIDLSVARTALEFRDSKCRQKTGGLSPEGAPAAVHSGLRFYNLDLSGGYSNSFAYNGVAGVSSVSDPVMLDRIYLHRGFTQYTSGSWNCSTRAWNSGYEQWAVHGLYWSTSASSGATQNLRNVTLQNSVIEITADGAFFFNGAGGGVTFRNNTFGFSGTATGNHRHEAAGIGTAGVLAQAAMYNNIFYVDEFTGTNFYEGNLIVYGTGLSGISANNNMFMHPWNSPVNMGSSGPVWRIAGGAASATLAQAIQTYSQETNSRMVCFSGCSGAAGTYHNDGANSRLYFVKDRPSVGSPSDYTPVVDINKGINTGLNSQCPAYDFYGNPRNDGQCDIGAVELQGSVEPAGPHRTDIRPGTILR